MFAASKTASVTGGYQISRSLRFNSADSAYLNRTLTTPTNNKIWTWSAWIKRSVLDVTQQIFSSRPTSSPYALIYFQSTGKLIYSETGLDVQTTQVFRDASAWYHFVIAIDTTQATASNRVKFYVNGTQITEFSTATYPSQNYDTQINTATQHNLSGAQPTTAEFFSGYMTEVNFIDGQALTPSSFGETNAQTGVWQPKAFAGTYGTNGFYLNFSDNSNTTAATLGKDYSGNGNNWTPNNFSVTAGVGNDSMVDVPTPYGVDTGVGGEVRGNYCTINPLDGVGTATISKGNLKFVCTGANAVFRGTMGMTGGSGKWYFEFTQQTAVTSLTPIVYGMGSLQGTPSHTVPTRAATYYTDVLGKYLLINLSGTQTLITVATAIAINEILQFAYDSDTGKVWIGKGGVWSDSAGGTTGNPATGANATYTFASVDQPMTPMFDHAGVDYTATLNCGQRAFVNTAPSGFKALCTQNLPTPTIGATSNTLASSFFAPVLYTGNNGTQSITVGFQPDFLWIKARSSALNHNIWDAVRTRSKFLYSNLTNAEATSTAGVDLISFDTNGFTLGQDSSANSNSSGGVTYVSWNWKANGSGSTNTAGSITSTVSANTTSGFSVLTYTGTGSAATIGHGLGVAPSMLIFKSRSNGSENWNVYHKSLGTSNNILLNTTGAAFNDTAFINNTAPTSSVLSVGGASSTGTNQASGTYVCYAFAPIAGYSAFGSYTGNGSADGPFVFTGFRPAYVLIRVSSAASQWLVFDATRNPSNAADLGLRTNTSTAEELSVGASPVGIDFLSNGFKIRTTDAWANPTSGTIIYAAFATAPFKYSLAR